MYGTRLDEFPCFNLIPSPVDFCAAFLAYSATHLSYSSTSFDIRLKRFRRCAFPFRI